MKPSRRFVASSIDQAYNNGINGLVVHKTDRANVTGNVLWDNGQVPRSEPEARQPYAGLTLNHAEDVEVSCDWSPGHVTAVLISYWWRCGTTSSRRSTMTTTPTWPCPGPSSPATAATTRSASVIKNIYILQLIIKNI